MKLLIIIRTFGPLLLAFGLISCNEDKPSTQSAIKVADGFTLNSLGGEIHPQAEGLIPSQSLVTQIHLTTQGARVPESTNVDVNIKSVCSSGDSSLSQNLDTHLRSSYPFFELVPHSLLLESSLSPRKWLCNFEFKAIDKQGNQHIFDIKNISLKNTSEGLLASLYQDSAQVEIQNASLPVLILQSDLGKYTVEYENGSATNMELSCEDFQWPLLGKNVNYEKLHNYRTMLPAGFDLNKKPVQRCRVAIFTGDQLVALSPLLQIIFDENLNNAEVQTEIFEPQTYTWHFETRPQHPIQLMKVTLKNTSNYPRQFRVDFSQFDSTAVSFINGYKYQDEDHSRSIWFSQELEAELSLPEGAIILSETFQNWVVELPPLQQLSVNIPIRFSHNCGSMGFFDGAAVLAGQNTFHIGQLVQLEQGLSPDLYISSGKLPEFLIFNPVQYENDQNLVRTAYQNFTRLLEKPNACHIIN